jgi:hypothetical protein
VLTVGEATGRKRDSRSSWGVPSLFLPADRVRIVQLESDERDVDSSVHPPRQPRVGEIATVLAEVAEGIYLLERCTDDGHALWTAEFLASELELVERH